ncbi:hypothetical protein DYB31_005917 [Aphanomyces astaci]|uniref:CEP76 C2 domain-containing protein n=1 Tax=Aphanomyces astaci TaxID=112090 RepID=A0A397F3B0_APHAT|nr:hypothetical protein DYB31_005917 [Aphanomyces astaci]
MSAPSDVVPDDAPGTSLASLRAVIDAKLRDEGIYAQLRSLLHAHATANLVHHDGGTPDLTTPDHDDNDRLLHTLLESDVVQQLIASIQPPPLSSSPSVTKQFTAQEGTAVPSWSHQGSPRSQPVVVHVRVLGGRAFVDNLVDIAPPACVLNLRVDIPAVHKTTATTHDAKLFLQKETISTHGTQSHLYQYCKHWWADYLRDHRNATSTTSISKLEKYHVCTYVTPLRSLHLSTPSEAARFVSLLPFVRASHVGSGRDATWQVVLWEAVTGECVAASAAMYDRVDCVFNHQSFYANCQDRIEFALVDWTVENPQLWKALDPALIAQVGPRQPSVALRPPVKMTDDAPTDRALRHWLQATRAAHGLHTTRWHPDLSHYIRMALTSYEVERVFGSANVDNVYFQNSVQGAVPQGHTFKGFPVSGTSLDDVQRKLVADVVGREVVLFPKATHAQFGVAVKSVPYPEGICVIWAMVAVVYKTS